MEAASAHALRVTRVLRCGALVVVAGYATALCYRAGLARVLLPRRLSASLEAVVHTVQVHSEPLGNAHRVALARRHLMRVYAWAACGVCDMVTGAALFCCYPYVPLWLPLSTSLVSGVTVCVVPRRWLRASTRALCFVVTWLSVGYVAGPVAYVAQDSLVVPLWLTMCTLVGLVVPLFVTRGVVSYMVSTQVLPCALALALLTLSTTAPPPPAAASSLSSLSLWRGVMLLRAPRAMRVVLDADVNVMLTLQLVANASIAALHTLPTLWRLVLSPSLDHATQSSTAPRPSHTRDKRSSDNSGHRRRHHDDAHDADDAMAVSATHAAAAASSLSSSFAATAARVAEADAMREAACICAGWAYVTYRTVRGAVRLLLRRVFADEAAHEARERGVVRHEHGHVQRTLQRLRLLRHDDDEDEDGMPSAGYRGGGDGDAWPRTRSSVWSRRVAHTSRIVDGASGATSGLLMLLLYVKTVSYLQRGDVRPALDRVRKVFMYVSPITWLVGRNVAYTTTM